jgi:hypothetical protein
MRLFSDEYLARRKAAGQNDPVTAIVWWVLMLGSPTMLGLLIWHLLSWALS